MEEWEKIKKRNSNRKKDSDDDDSDKDESNQEYSRCEKLAEMVRRPRKELIQELTVAPAVVKNRVTFQTVILKGFNEFNKTFAKSNNTFVEDGFRDKVHKSNVKKWIKLNLINSADPKHP